MNDQALETVTESQFYMWRALFAVAHADDVVTDEEVRFMVEALEDIPFSTSQYAILSADMKDRQDIEEMFQGITDSQDQATFFRFARQLAHIDGDFDEKEQDVLTRLQRQHMQNADFDAMVGSVRMDLVHDDLPEFKKCEKLTFKDKVCAVRDVFFGRK